MHNNLIEAEAFFDLYNTFKTIGDVGYETTKFGINVAADVMVLSKVKVAKNIVLVGETAYTIVYNSKKYGGIYDENGNINDDTAKLITSDVLKAVGFNIIAMNGIEKEINNIESLEYKDYIVETIEGLGNLVLEKVN